MSLPVYLIMKWHFSHYVYLPTCFNAGEGLRSREYSLRLVVTKITLIFGGERDAAAAADKKASTSLRGCARRQKQQS